MNLIFLGPPGVGKGTIAKKVGKKRGIPQISTGDLLRAAVKEGTPLGKNAKEYMDAGKLVPDSLVILLLKDRLVKDDCFSGYILDGFPRNISQAQALARGNVKIDHVLNFIATGAMVIERISGRRTCKGCNAIYHIRNIPPKVEGVCDRCGAELFQREDDKLEKVKERLEVYMEQTAPLIDFYKKKGMLVDIETDQPIPGIVADVLKAI